MTRTIYYFLPVVLLSLACPQEMASPGNTPPPAAASAAASKEAPLADAKTVDTKLDDQDYVQDGEGIPSRVGVTRIFAKKSKVLVARDPVLIPNTQDFLFVGKIGGNAGFYRMPFDASRPATLEIPVPRFDKKHPKSIKNRTDWFFGAPRYFNDGEHFIFDVTRARKDVNYLGVAKLGSSLINILEMKDAIIAQTPDVLPDGRILFAACDELRIATPNGHGDQTLESEVIVTLKAGSKERGGVCPIYRPRVSRDGKYVLFEVLGRLLDAAVAKKYNVPAPGHPSDYIAEIWAVDIDGKNLRRFISDEGYKDIGGRIQPGGSREVEFSPDGSKMSFAHGRRVVVGTREGKDFKVVANDIIKGGNNRVQFHEEDPTWIDDDTIISSSRLASDTRLAPPGFSVIELKKIIEQ